MTRRWSIALRLALWLSIGTALFWAGAASISAFVMQRELTQAFDESLRQSALRLLPLARRDFDDDDGHRRGPVPRINGPVIGPLERRGPRPMDDDGPAPVPVGEEAFTYVVYDPAGNIVVRAEDAPEAPGNLPTRDGFLSLDDHRAFAASDRRTGLRILVVETTDARARAFWEAMAGLLWPLAALIPIVAVAIWFAVRAALRPVERLSRDVATRGSANLAPLSDADQPAELAPIAQEIAALLGRLRAAMEAERAFAASSAHELRTPIAGALAQTQRLALDLGDHPAVPRVRGVERALRHLSELAEKLLQLSRLEAGFARSDQPVDLRPVLELVVRDTQARIAIGTRLVFAEHPGAELTHSINPDAFAIAVRNLIQNADIHGAADGEILVDAGPGPIVRVRSHGPVVAPEVLARLRERFRRGATRASGTGLGLAVVDAIMGQTGGRLVLRSPVEGWTDGFEAVLELG